MIISSSREIALLRTSGKLLAHTLAELSRLVTPGLVTDVLENYARHALRTAGATPSFLNFKGYPNALCVSINDEVVHGMSVPARTLAAGDIVSLDLGVEYRGYFTDGAVTIHVGTVSRAADDLVRHTQKSLEKGIKVIRAEATAGDIGAAIQGYLEPRGYGIVVALVGHGVGKGVHEEPQIPNVGICGKGSKLIEGMVLAIEPMVSQRSGEVDFLDDGWTVVTRERCLAAHFEHTVVVTKIGCEILTSL